MTPVHIAAAEVAGAPPSWAPSIERLPERVPFSSLVAAARVDALPIGLRDDDLTTATVDVSDSHWLAIGPYRSGRSNALGVLAMGLAEVAPGAELLLLAPRRSPLREMPVWRSAARTAEDCGREIGDVLERMEGGAFEQADAYLFIDDGGELTDPRTLAQMERLVRMGRDARLRVVAGVETAAARSIGTAWIRELRREANGLLLQPDLAADGDLLAVRLPRRVAVAMTPGRGFLASRGNASLLQVAQAVST